MSQMFRDRVFFTFALAFIVLLAITGTVSAHTVELLKSDPPAGAVLNAPPALVHAWFNEEMQTKVSTMNVYNSAGVQVDQGDGGVDLNDAEHASMIVNLQGSLPEDVYTVRWHVALLDGDDSEGDFQFFVGQAAATAAANMASPTPLSAAAEPETTGSSSPSILLILGGTGGLVLVLILGVLLVRGNKGSS